nr:hypothetical protein [Tanacetum cinerariifolium]
MKARGTLLMALPNKYQLKFHSYQNAKLLMEAIEKRYGGNKEYKKLEIQGEVIEQEDINLKLLRSLPSEWKTHALIWRNKSEIKTISLDGLYNNLKIYEPELTRSSSTSLNLQNVAFVSSNSTNEVDDTSYEVSTTHTQVAREDLEQINADDLEEIDLHWEIAMLTIKARRFIKRTGMNLDINGQKIGFDKSKVECFNCHKMDTLQENLELQRLKKTEEESMVEKLCQWKISWKNALIAQHGIGGAVKTVESKVKSINVKNKGVYSTVETKLVRKKNFSPPIIEDWNFDDESEVEFKPKVEVKTVRPCIEKIKFVKIAKEKVYKYDCDKRVVRPVWNNSRRVNHMNFANKMTHPHLKRRFFPQAILTKSDKLKTVGTPVNPVKPVDIVDSKPIVNYSRPISNAFKRGYSQAIRPFNNYSAYKNTIFNKEGNPHQKEYKEKGVINSSCSRHMIGNKCYLIDYEDYDSGFVSFRDGKGRISRKCKIKTGTLDFNDVYFYKELKYNMFRIKREFGVAKTPQQNGVAERKNRTLIEAARTMALVIKPHNKTPYELIRRIPSLIDFMKPFGCPVTILNNKNYLSKFDKKLMRDFLKDTMCQDKYVADILKNFDFSTTKTASTLMEPNKALVKDVEAEDVDVHLYRLMIGSLMYLKASRPDITFTVCACARDSPFDLEAYSSSDYAGASLKRKPITGEYIAAASCCKQVLWIQNQMLDYGFNVMNTKIYIDNKNKTVYKEWEDIMERATTTTSSLEAEKLVHVVVPGAKLPYWGVQKLKLGTACLPNDTIFKELARMGSTMASAIICLANNQKINFSKYILDNMVKHLEGGVKFVMFLRFLQVFLDKQVEGMAKHIEIYVISSHTKKVFANIRRQRQGFSRNVTPLFETMMKNIKPKRKQRQAAEVHSLCSKIPIEESILTPSNDLLPSGEDSIQLNELMIFGTNLRQQLLDLEEAKISEAKEIAKLKKRVKKLEKRKKSRPAGLRRLKKVGPSKQVESSKEKDSLGAQGDASKQGRSIEDIDQDAKIALVGESQRRMHDAYMFRVDDLEVITASVEDSVAPTTATTADVDDELTLEKTPIAIKAVKPRIAREKDEANRAMVEEYDDIEATIDADRQLAKQIQAQEREQLSIEERSKLLVELIESRRKEYGGKPKEKSSRTDDTAKLKRCLEIVYEDYDDVAIEATPISSKSPTIVDYKIYKEGKKSYFKIIRADENSQNYQTFRTMFKNFNKEDLEVLRSIVKERFKKKNPVDDMENLLFQTLKTMFEPHVKDII